MRGSPSPRGTAKLKQHPYPLAIRRGQQGLGEGVGTRREAVAGHSVACRHAAGKEPVYCTLPAVRCAH